MKSPQICRTVPNPRLTVVMANMDGGAHIGSAIASVLCQSRSDLELIVSDDASTDQSVEIVQQIAARDPRVRLVRSEERGGPARARNRALELARGSWIAIVDSDDLLHPLRMERMIDRAEQLGVDVIADDLIYFGANLGRTLLGELRLTAPWLPTKAEFLEAEMARPAIPVGYLKPVIRRDAIGTLRYRTYLTVGEDFDFLLRILLGGACIAVLPEAYYLYRRHAESISHRLSGAAIDAMLKASEALREEVPPELLNLLERRRNSQVTQKKFTALVEALKGRRASDALRILAATPSLGAPLSRSVIEHVSRRFRSRQEVRTVSHFSLAARDDGGADPLPYTRLRVPSEPADWTPARAATLIARTGSGPVRLRAHGRAGLDALGYVPGWEAAELIAPRSGWTEQERHRISGLPWPVLVS